MLHRISASSLASATTGMVGRDDLTWRESALGLSLHRAQSAVPLLHVVPDLDHAGLWRVRHLGGRVIDILNLTRAKDAAVALALRSLNTEKLPHRK